MSLLTQKILLIKVILLSAVLQSTAQFMYRTRYKSALQAEVFGISPIMSINYEAAPIRFERNFLAAKVGVGYIPGTSNPAPGMPADAGISFPVGVSYNYLLNNLKKGVFKRVMNKCKTKPPKFAVEYFAEAGAGASFAFYSISDPRQYYYAVFGFRQQMVIDIPPKPKVIYLRATINPQYFDNRFRIISKTGSGGYAFNGGISLGFSL